MSWATEVARGGPEQSSSDWAKGPQADERRSAARRGSGAPGRCMPSCALWAPHACGTDPPTQRTRLVLHSPARTSGWPAWFRPEPAPRTRRSRPAAPKRRRGRSRPAVARGREHCVERRPCAAPVSTHSQRAQRAGDDPPWVRNSAGQGAVAAERRSSSGMTGSSAPRPPAFPLLPSPTHRPVLSPLGPEGAAAVREEALPRQAAVHSVAGGDKIKHDGRGVGGAGRAAADPCERCGWGRGPGWGTAREASAATAVTPTPSQSFSTPTSFLTHWEPRWCRTGRRRRRPARPASRQRRR